MSYTRTEEHRKLMSKIKKGSFHSEETKERMRKAKKGKSQSKKHVVNNVRARMNNGKFKADAKYNAIHEWIRRRKVKPEKCERCNEAKPFDLANLSGKYKRSVEDYQWLCRKCHYNFDRRIVIRGLL